jgi:hypothetical protein
MLTFLQHSTRWSARGSQGRLSAAIAASLRQFKALRIRGTGFRVAA